jgi:hypothetical protein
VSLALIFAGVLFLAAAVRSSQDDLYGLLKKDLTGSNNFLQWVLALALVGALGFIPKFKPFSVSLLALILVAIFLRKGTGFFDQLSSATGIKQTS